jgi:hypothetical protein
VWRGRLARSLSAGTKAIGDVGEYSPSAICKETEEKKLGKFIIHSSQYSCITS